MSVTHKVAGSGALFAANAVFSFVTGQPETNPSLITPERPYTRSFKVLARTPGWDPVELEVPLLLLGSKAISDKFSVPFPQHTPLAVIRDPPGGLSYAEYTSATAKLRTIIRSRHKETARRQDLKSFGTDPKIFKIIPLSHVLSRLILGDRRNFQYSYKPILFHVSGGISFCHNIGPVGICADAPAAVSYSTLHEYDLTTFDFNDQAAYNTAAGINLHVQVSFATAGERDWQGSDRGEGRSADMYLLPILNIVFSEAADIGWNESTCTATSTPAITWSLRGDENKDLTMWRSEHDIRRQVIPDLQRVLDAEVAKGKDAELNKVVTLNESIAGFQSILAQSDKVYELAAKGKLETAPNLLTSELTSGQPATQGFSFSGGGAMLHVSQTFHNSSSTREASGRHTTDTGSSAGHHSISVRSKIVIRNIITKNQIRGVNCLSERQSMMFPLRDTFRWSILVFWFAS